MFFDGWNDLLRIMVIGPLAYIGLIVVLRLSGKRTLAKWNAFDMVVTIALGSTLATLLLTRQVSYVEGMAGLGVLVILQYLVARLTVSATWFRKLVKAEPRFLYKEGEFLQRRLDEERVTESEVRAAARGAGLADMGEVDAIVLETDGSVSVIRKTNAAQQPTLSDVR